MWARGYWPAGYWGNGYWPAMTLPTYTPTTGEPLGMQYTGAELQQADSGMALNPASGDRLAGLQDEQRVDTRYVGRRLS